MITNTGFVGIGTTSPGTTLAVAGAGLFNSTLTAFSTITAPSFTVPPQPPPFQVSSSNYWQMLLQLCRISHFSKSPPAPKPPPLLFSLPPPLPLTSSPHPLPCRAGPLGNTTIEERFGYWCQHTFFHPLGLRSSSLPAPPPPPDSLFLTLPILAAPPPPPLVRLLSICRLEEHIKSTAPTFFPTL